MNAVRVGLLMLCLLILASHCMHRVVAVEPARKPLNEQDIRPEQSAANQAKR